MAATMHPSSTAPYWPRSIGRRAYGMATRRVGWCRRVWRTSSSASGSTAPRLAARRASRSRGRPSADRSYNRSTMALANSEHLTSVAPSIRRAKS